jgi:hypothetical protein
MGPCGGFRPVRGFPAQKSMKVDNGNRAQSDNEAGQEKKKTENIKPWDFVHIVLPPSKRAILFLYFTEGLYYPSPGFYCNVSVGNSSKKSRGLIPYLSNEMFLAVVDWHFS